MFIGHFAAGFGASKLEKAPSLALMFVAVQFLDLLWPILVLLGIESFEIQEGVTRLTPLNFIHYPYSHSLLMSLVWAVILGAGYFFYSKSKKGAVLIGLLVFSHWVLDFVTHRPDLALYPGSEIKLGLGMWNLPFAESILEFGIFGLGIFLYLRSGRKFRKVAFWSLVGFLFTLHLMNILGPPPPSIAAVAWSANLLWLTVLWAWWIEKPIKRKD